MLLKYFTKKKEIGKTHCIITATEIEPRLHQHIVNHYSLNHEVPTKEKYQRNGVATRTNSIATQQENSAKEGDHYQE